MDRLKVPYRLQIAEQGSMVAYVPAGIFSEGFLDAQTCRKTGIARLTNRPAEPTKTTSNAISSSSIR